jgi:hypothetical protein
MRLREYLFSVGGLRNIQVFALVGGYVSEKIAVEKVRRRLMEHMVV